MRPPILLRPSTHRAMVRTRRAPSDVAFRLRLGRSSAGAHRLVHGGDRRAGQACHLLTSIKMMQHIADIHASITET